MEHYLKKELYDLLKKDEAIFDFIQEGSLDGLWYWDLENPENEWMNKRFWEVLGYNPDEMPHKASAWKDIINQDDLKKAIDNFNKHLADPKYPYDQDVRYTHKNGSIVWVRCRGLAIRDENNKPIRMFGVHQNIMTSEKKAHDILQESEEKYRAIFNNAPLAIQSLDINGNILEVNPQWLKTLLYEKEEIIGKWFGDFLHPDFVDHFKKNFPEFKKRGFVNDVQFKMQKKNGEYIYVSFEGCIGYTPEGDFKQTYCTFKDITKEIEYNAKLIEQNEKIAYSKAQYKKISDMSTDYSYSQIIDDEGNITVEWNFGAFEEITGYKAFDIVSAKQIINFIHPDDLDKYKKRFKKLWGGESVTDCFRIVSKNGKVKWIKDNAIPEWSEEKKKVIRIVGTAREITNQKEAEIKLKESEERFRKLVEIASDAIYLIDQNGFFVDVNHTALKMLGRTREEIIGSEASIVDPTFPRDVFVEYINKLEFDKQSIFETNHITKNGEKIPVEISSKKFLVNNEVFYYGIARDISERKNAEEEIKKQRDLFETVINSVPDRIFWKDKNSVYLGCNTHFAKDAGKDSVDSVIGKTDDAMVWKDDAEHYQKHDKEVMQSGEPMLSYEEAFVGTKGEDVIWRTSKMPLKDSNGEIIGIVATSENITKHKFAEQKLKESEEKFRGLFEFANIGIAIGDAEGKVIDVNNEYLSITDYTREEFIGLNYSKITHPNDLEIEASLLQEIKEGKRNEYRIEKRLKAKNGEYVWLDSAITCMRDNENNVYRLMALVIDITEKRKATESIKVFFEQSINLHLISTIDGEILRANQGWESILGYKKNEVEGINFIELVHPDDVDITLKEMKLLDQGKKTLYFENRYLHKNGNYVTLAWSAIANTSSHQIHAVAKDVTAEQQSKLALIKSEEKYRELFQNMNEGFAHAKIIFDENSNATDWEYITVNPAFEKLYDVDAIDIIGKNTSEVLDRKNDDSIKMFKYLVDTAVNSTEHYLEIELENKKKHLSIHSFSPRVGEWAATFADISERKIVEEKLKEKLSIENLLSKLSSDFIQTEDIDASINKAFAEFGLINNASRIYLFSIDDEKFSMSNDYEWCNEGVVAEKINLQDLPLDIFPWWLNKLRNKEIINIPDVSKMPKVAQAEKDILEKQEIKSVLVIPIFIKSKLYGYVGFDNISENTIWDTANVYLLEMLASTLANALERRQDERKIRDKNAEYEELNKELNNANAELSLTIKREELINERFNLAMQATSDGLWDWDLKNQKMYFSTGWKSMLGYSDDELIDDLATWEKLTDDEDVKRSREMLDKLFKKEIKKFDIELKMQHKNGHWLDIHSRADVFFDNEGVVARVVGTHSDITQQKLIENQIRENDEKLRLAIDNSPLGICINDMDGNFISSNKAYEDLVGYSKDELLNLSFYDITPPEYLPENRKLYSSMGTKESKGYHLDKKYIRKDGKYIDVSIYTGTIYNNVGEPSFGMAFVEDVTDKKLAENLLKISEARFKRAESIGHVGNWEYNILTDEFWASEEAKKLFGLDKENEEITLEKAESHIVNNERTKKALMDLIEYDTPYDIEYDLYIPQTDVRRSIHSVAILEKNKDGKPYSVIGVINDITDQKEYEQTLQTKNEEYELLNQELSHTNEELIIAKEKAEESNRLKSEFLHNMSHEIRTPMNGIVGFSELLSEPGIGDDKRNYYTTIIKNSSNQLLRIIDDILEISILETKQQQLNTEVFSINDFVVELFSIFDIIGRKRKIPVYLKKALADDDAFIVSDKVKLNKIISNLLENALKFTNNGFVELGYEVENDKLVLYVKDTGIGISQENMERIFMRFSQESKDTAHTYGGLGLGLSIAKENAELLGGELIVESEKTKGSTFYVKIPFEKSNKSNPKSSIDEISENNNNVLNILIAEDEEVNYLYIEAILETVSEYNVKLCHTINGLDTVEKCLNDDSVQLVLMDIKMPVMNGYQAAEKISEQKPDLPIIAQTAYSTTSEKEKALKHGCIDFISKPIKKEELLALIDKYLIND